jgi:hypothetical protein
MEQGGRNRWQRLGSPNAGKWLELEQGGITLGYFLGLEAPPKPLSHAQSDDPRVTWGHPAWCVFGALRTSWKPLDYAHSQLSRAIRRVTQSDHTRAVQLKLAPGHVLQSRNGHEGSQVMTQTATQMESRTLPVPGATLYLEARGSGPVLLLITGGPTDAGMFTELAGRLADR